MATKYKVKQGDTLGDIAASKGVSISDITGFKSGDPDLIHPGEELTIADISETPDNSFKGKDVEGMDIKELSSQMAQEFGETPEGAEEEGIGKYETEYEDYGTKRDEAFQNLKGITTSTFETEYEDRKLEEKKERISNIDDEITAARQTRDEAIAKVRANPGLSAAQMTGDVKKLSDFQNKIINNKIGERNSVAGEYNSELGEIDRIVEGAVSDAKAEYAYYSGLYSEAGTKVSDYQKALREELLGEQAQSNFEKQLAQALTIAQMKDTGTKADSANWKLVYDDYGQPLYWFNSKTKEIDYNVGEGEVDAGDSTFEDIEAELGDEGGDEAKWWQFWK